MLLLSAFVRRPSADEDEPEENASVVLTAMDVRRGRELFARVDHAAQERRVAEQLLLAARVVAQVVFVAADDEDRFADLAEKVVDVQHDGTTAVRLPAESMREGVQRVERQYEGDENDSVHHWHSD